MAWVTVFALGFIIWWTVLFAILPLGVRSQADEGDIILGTTESAPAAPRMLRVVLLTTLVTGIILGAFFGVTWGLGYSFDDIPNFVPDIRVHP